MMSSNEEESASNGGDQLSTPTSPVHPMSTDWSNHTMDDTAQEMVGDGDEDDAVGGGGGGGPTSRRISIDSLHGTLRELSPIWAAADSDLIGDTLSVVAGDNFDSPVDEAFASTSHRSFSSKVDPPANSVSTPTTPAAAIFGPPMESIEQRGPLELPTKTRLKVRVKRLDIVGAWRWVDGKEDACGICRTPFETCCMDCKYPGDECPLVLGQCKHPFHMHCIVKWTNTQSGQKPACPLCRQEWKFATS